MFKSEDDRVRLQLQLLTTFVRGGGQLWVLDDLWTQVGIVTEITVSTSFFNSSHQHINVSFFVTVIS